MSRGRIHRPETQPQTVLPIIGNIKCGIKGERNPKSLDYFIASGKYADLFTSAYPGKPNTIQIVFVTNDDRSCNERYEYRDEKGDLFAKGDGQVFHIWDGKRYAERKISDTPDIMKQVEKLCPKSHKGWEVILTLRFLIPKIREVAGIWQYTTRGDKSSIPNIVSTFDMVNNTANGIVGVVFDLAVQFAKSQKPGDASRYPVVNLIPNLTQTNQQILKESFINPEQKKLT